MSAPTYFAFDVVSIIADQRIEAAADINRCHQFTADKTCHSSQICVWKPSEISSSFCLHPQYLPNNIIIMPEQGSDNFSICFGSTAIAQHGSNFILTEFCDASSVLELQVQVVFSVRGM